MDENSEYYVRPACTRCHQDNSVRNGRATNGNRRYKCKNCGHNFCEHNKRAVIDDYVRTEVLHARYEATKNGIPPSARSLAKMFNINHVVISQWIKDFEHWRALRGRGFKLNMVYEHTGKNGRLNKTLKGILPKKKPRN